jgi:hypothetical protein
MDDDTRIELERSDISQETEADTENLPSVDPAPREQQSLLEPPSKYEYLKDARSLVGLFVEEPFKNMVNPYEGLPERDIKRNQAWLAYTHHNANGELEKVFGSVSAACDAFVKEVKQAFDDEIDRRAGIEGRNEELRTLFVSARKDKARALESGDDLAASMFNENLANSRACISLLSGKFVSQELAPEISFYLSDRVAFYRKSYDEFEPPKEVD